MSVDENDGFEKQERVEIPSEPYVRYTGIATVRRITAEEWERVGAPGTPEVEWSFANAFCVPLSEFSEDAIRYLKQDDRFVIEG